MLINFEQRYNGATFKIQNLAQRPLDLPYAFAFLYSLYYIYVLWQLSIYNRARTIESKWSVDHGKPHDRKFVPTNGFPVMEVGIETVKLNKKVVKLKN